uniref:Uncharacterized protein n=1 Tax=Spermophilus dauricus TaxID=99837 RepID=A0A8C9PJH6_SPEDA
SRWDYRHAPPHPVRGDFFGTQGCLTTEPHPQPLFVPTLLHTHHLFLLLPPVNHMAPGMVGPGMIIDKKMWKKRCTDTTSMASIPPLPAVTLTEYRTWTLLSSLTISFSSSGSK